MHADQLIIMEKKRLSPACRQQLSAGTLSIETQAIANVLGAMQRRIVALEAHNRRGQE